MDSILQSIILGIIQGITEWLPVSSSGHLVIVQNLLNIEQPVIFDIILHLGSLIVIFIIFWNDIIDLVKGIFVGDKKHLNYLYMLIVATIPIGLIGYFFNDFIKSIFQNARTVGYSLLFTAVILFLSKYSLKQKQLLKIKNSFVIGVFQALAILPGVSRSGVTISSGMLLGIDKQEVAKFSFLMFIPAILGATILEIKNVGTIENVGSMVIGFITVIIVGYFTLKILLRIIQNNKFHYFSIYCLILGIIILL